MPREGHSGSIPMPPTAAGCCSGVARPSGKRVANDQEGQIQCSNLAFHLLGLVGLVGDTGIEPVTSTVSRCRCHWFSSAFWLLTLNAGEAGPTDVPQIHPGCP